MTLMYTKTVWAHEADPILTNRINVARVGFSTEKFWVQQILTCFGGFGGTGSW